MTRAESMCPRLVVAAMDFGTTFSGYAFSFRSNPLDIHTNPNWVAGCAQLISNKNQTCVLLKPNKEFAAFGFAAESRYMDLAEDDEHRDYYMFRRFKMKLYETKKLDMHSTIEDVTGKALPAVDIFAHAIRYLRDHMLNTLQTCVTGIQPDDILYVLTVPAIWDERAKQFMRKAANKAGIPNDQLRIALEPEAASVWCQVCTDDKITKLSDAGTKYMVVDLGGGTADITVHEKLVDGRLRELHRASGGEWGGNRVEQSYIDCLTAMVGHEVMDEFRREHTGDYMTLLMDLETKKRTVTASLEGKVTLTVPLTFSECCHKHDINIQDRINKSPFKDKMKWTRDRFRIDKTVAKSLIDIPLRPLMHHIDGMFKEPSLKDVNAILLVGGFAESEIVQAEFKKMFPDKILMIPKDASLAVLKGAVRFGHMPDVISNRIARYSFGREAWPKFDEGEHDPGRKTKYCGNDVCQQYFWKMVEIGDDLPLGKEVSEEIPGLSAEQTGAHIKVFCSASTDTKYVDEDTCTQLGELIVPLPDSSDPKDKNIKVSFIFGDTELKVWVQIIKTGEELERNVDL
ncbi:heat shock 70 kDa protein 12B-like [Mya arenaria]|uniref:heat shock 70 kDa protein 12B-like n=1 Tax=Mya arenaria TaxID=6604 RepID=UPI0022E1C26A|nr:heat shock 70 kDa protein 12B-like [Mya arenaria]XP_052798833.1 heat shock 70 kDa protein 12B-like [Mya arenaria]XP_052798834.1 heat shock 70 kDa protein 12B-like [Mya arenaria]XP_052798835.1 heat shock 70 kDa protein 12B-like [Mya arenaria]